MPTGQKSMMTAQDRYTVVWYRPTDNNSDGEYELFANYENSYAVIDVRTLAVFVYSYEDAPDSKGHRPVRAFFSPGLNPRFENYGPPRTPETLPTDPSRMKRVPVPPLPVPAPTTAVRTPTLTIPTVAPDKSEQRVEDFLQTGAEQSPPASEEKKRGGRKRGGRRGKQQLTLRAAVAILAATLFTSTLSKYGHVRG